MANKEEKISIRIIECGSITHPGRGLLRHLRGDRLPVNCFLIEKNNVKLLVDTGADSSIVARLRELGVAPEEIDVVAFTCLDADHTGGLKALLETASPRVLLSDEELYWMERNKFKKNQPKDNIEGVKHERFFYKACMDAPLKYHFDVMGDESVRLYLCTGHSFGSAACVLTNNRTGRFAVLAGDIILNASTFEEGEIYHQSQQIKVVKWLKALAAKPECVAVLPTHERYGENRIVEL